MWLHLIQYQLQPSLHQPEFPPSKSSQNNPLLGQKKLDIISCLFLQLKSINNPIQTSVDRWLRGGKVRHGPWSLVQPWIFSPPPATAGTDDPGMDDYISPRIVFEVMIYMWIVDFTLKSFVEAAWWIIIRALRQQVVSWPPLLLHQGADLHFEKWSQGSGRQLPATSGGAQIHLLEKWLQLSRGREGRGGGDSSMRNGYKSHKVLPRCCCYLRSGILE